MTAVVLTAAAGFVVSRHTASEMAQWFLPPDMALNELSGLAVNWRGGRVQRLELTTPQGRLFARATQWQWQIRIDRHQPLRLLAVASEAMVWTPTQPSAETSVSKDAEGTLRIPDFRQASWWAAVASASIAIDSMRLALADTSVEVQMSAPVALEGGALTGNAGAARFDVEWAGDSEAEWVGNVSLTASTDLHFDWRLTPQDRGYKLSGLLKARDLPVSESQLVLTFFPFLGDDAKTPLLSVRADAQWPLPDPLLNRILTIQANAQLDSWGGGLMTVITPHFASPFPDERLNAQIEATWDPAFANPTVMLKDGELSLINVEVGEQQLTHVASKATGAWDPDTGRGRLETTETDLAIAAADWRADIRSSGLSMTATTEEQIVSGSLQIDTRVLDDTLPSFDAVVSVSNAGEETQTEVTGFAPWGPVGEFKLRFSRDQAAVFEAQLDTALWDWPRLQREMAVSQPELAEVAVTDFNLHLEAAGQWSEQGLSATVAGQASDGYFSTTSLGVAGLQLAPFTLRVVNDSVTPVHPIAFSLDAVNAGITLTNLTGSVDQDDQGWVMTHANGVALGGELVVDQFRDFSADGPLGTIYLNDIDLAAVADIAGTEGVSINGRATAALPLLWQGGRVLVDAGTLRGTPGFLQYQPSVDPTEIDQRVGAVAAALSNLHFEQLDAGITLDEAGVLFLRTSVLGSNPDYENGRQVKLNLTLENNLRSLLKSLQTVESVNLWVTRKFEQQN